MKKKYEIFLDTDILIEHMSGMDKSEISILEKCVNLFDECYTSVVNASEIFSECKRESSINKAKKAFDRIGILGIPFRYSVSISRVMNAIKKKSPETLIGMH
jgi:predicted nucleic acid-binding protein